MKTIRIAQAVIGSTILLGAPATAQTITKLIAEGDSIATGMVTSIANVDVNNSGDWLVELDTDNPDTSLDNAIVYNGTVIHQEGTSMGFPAAYVGAWVYDSFVDTMDINDNGDRLLMFNVEDATGALSDRKLVLWTSGATQMTYGILEDDVTPNTVMGEPSGAVWDSLTEVWQNNNNEMIVAGRSNSDGDDMLVFLTHDGMGSILTQTQFAVDNVIHNVAFPAATGIHADTVQGFTFSKQNISLNNAGQKMFYVDDQSFGPGGMPDYTMVDSHYYVDNTEIAWEGDDAPTAGSFPYNHLSSAEVDINDSGTWVAVWDDDNTDTSQDFFINVNGTIFQQEGQAPPGIGGGFVMTGASWGHVQISDTEEITWYADWDDPDTTVDSGLFRDQTLLVQEGVTMLGGIAVDTISSSSDGMAASDNGVYIITELTLEGSLEGAYMIEIPLTEPYCFGDGSGVTCPCGNIGGAGEGCGNSSSLGGILEVSGTTVVAQDDLVLVGSQLPPNRPGLFFMGTTQVAGGMGSVFGDGLLCVGGPIQRIEVVFSDGTGAANSSVPVASSVGAVAGTTTYFQLWYRDAAVPCGTQFNTTNAMSVSWK